MWYTILLVASVCLLFGSVFSGARRLRQPRQQDEAAPPLPPSDAAGPAPVLVLDGLTKVYDSPAGPVVAVDGATAQIQPGMTALVGPSGQGKTSLLNCVGGLDRPTRGQVLYRGLPLRFEDEQHLRRFRANEVAWVLQELNLISHLTAIENTALPLLCRGVPRSEALAVARHRLEQVGMAHLTERRPHQLSRGQKQRVALARALTSGAPLILCDEPTASLDNRAAAVMVGLLRELSQREDRTVVLVTHNPALARRFCDHVLLCENGTLRRIRFLRDRRPRHAPPAADLPTTDRDEPLKV